MPSVVQLRRAVRGMEPLKDGAEVVEDRVEGEHGGDDVCVRRCGVFADEDLFVGAHALLQVSVCHVARAAEVVTQLPRPLPPPAVGFCALVYQLELLVSVEAVAQLLPSCCCHVCHVEGYHGAVSQHPIECPGPLQPTGLGVVLMQWQVEVGVVNNVPLRGRLEVVNPEGRVAVLVGGKARRDVGDGEGLAKVLSLVTEETKGAAVLVAKQLPGKH
mmetsp:Transcript_13976/g.39553  ORF Transcript_13976/g.39553 Transcript_13976/m.39553 type:complete len:216 (-) Transcript_13976:1377-2024(-)